MSIKVLVDTDVGSYIDDVVCLSYLLSNPDCKLLGITTVTDEAEKRARLASVLCKVADKKVPLCPGLERPLEISHEWGQIPQAKILKKWEHNSEFPKMSALDFLSEIIHDNPREIVLLSIGPLTNLACLFQKEPEIPSLIKGFVSMCGVFTDRFPEAGAVEWNAQWDPHATRRVCETVLPSHKFVGLDVTWGVTMDTKQFVGKVPPKWRQLILDFAETSFGPKNAIAFHDPLAATTIFDDHICTFEKGHVTVEVMGAQPGKTRFIRDCPDARQEVALQVDKARFFEHYFSVYS